MYVLHFVVSVSFLRTSFCFLLTQIVSTQCRQAYCIISNQTRRIGNDELVSALTLSLSSLRVECDHFILAHFPFRSSRPSLQSQTRSF